MPPQLEDTTIDEVNHYDILGLPRPIHEHGGGVSKDEVKAAYHRALLLHHPDKVPQPDPIAENRRSGVTMKGTRAYSIDQIMLAYQTLSDTALKAAYDARLLQEQQQRHLLGRNLTFDGVHLGVEVFDLEDMDYDEHKAKWSKSCRCGNEQGYTLTEAELEKEWQAGAIYVGCRGCSLFIKVLFGVADGDADA